MARRKNHFGFVFALPMIIAIIAGIVGVTVVAVVVYKQVTKPKPTNPSTTSGSTSTTTTTTTTLQNQSSQVNQAERRAPGQSLQVDPATVFVPEFLYGGITLDGKIYKSVSLEGPWEFVDNNTNNMEYITQIHDGTFIGIGSDKFIYTSGSFSGPWQKVSDNRDKYTSIVEYVTSSNTFGYIATNKNIGLADSFRVSSDFTNNSWKFPPSPSYLPFSFIMQLPSKLFVGESPIRPGQLTTVLEDFSSTDKNYGPSGTSPNTQIILSSDNNALISIKDNNLYITQLPLYKNVSLVKNSVTLKPDSVLVQVNVTGPVNQFKSIFKLK